MYEETLFHQAQEQPAAERAAFLDKMCGDDVALRQRVDALLQAHDNPGDFLAQPAMPQEQTVDEPRFAEKPGSRIGPYRLLQQIGEGGMGVVFMAEQTEPVRRRVALKVIKPGMDTRQVVARFEAERQALAMMDHPNIAKVFDGGTTDTERPYFVMELVKGVPITKYCDEHHLTPQQRLELFIPVCQAVQHAHQKGIIHRDLKPSNVLIALYDGKPVPKVIDFGVAKAVGGGLTDKTLYTDFGAVVGTLEYMSPEQAEPNQLDIDTRSDLYALGVLLYELLTGTTPFERKRLRAAALFECLRIIREEEPQKPSTRLSTAEQSPSVAANRGLEPKKLTGVVRGDLDWIVMKCLEKDRNRRYETANGLAMDVQRYLAVEPVLASSPSAAYRFRKFARRHKAALLTWTAALVVLLLAGVGSGWVLWDWAAQRTTTDQAVNNALVKAEQSEARANQRPITTSVEGKAALADWHDAEAALAEAEAALTTGASGNRIRERVTQVRQRIEEGQKQAERKETLFRDLDDARLTMATWVETHFDYAGAAVKYAAAFTDFGLKVQPGQTTALAQRIRDEEPAVSEALIVGLDYWAFCERTPFAGDLRAIARAADPDEWRREFRDASQKRDSTALVRLSKKKRGRLTLPPSNVQLLAYALNDNKLREEARDLLRWARGLHPSDFWIALELGYYLEGKASAPAEIEEAIGCCRVALALRPNSSAAHINLGIALIDKNQLDDAIAEFKKAIVLEPKNAKSHSNLGRVLMAKNELDDAIAEYKKTVEIDPNNADAHGRIGYALVEKNQLDDAIAELNKTIEIQPKDAKAHYNLGVAFARKKQLDDAITEFKKAIDIDPKHTYAHYNLGVDLAKKKQLDDAIAEYKKAIELDPKFREAHYNLGRVLANKNQLDDAISEFKKVIDIDPKDAAAHDQLGWTLRRQGKLEEAVTACRKAVALKPRDANCHNSLGYALRDQGKLDEAIAEFRQAIKIDPQFGAAVANLAKAEQMAALLSKLPDVLSGKSKSADNGERLGFIEICRLQQRHTDTAKLYGDAFTADATLADDLKAEHRYNAACSAALAANGEGKGTDKLTDIKRSDLRKQAAAWLRADLALWTKQAASDKVTDRELVQKTLKHWQDDTDLTAIRDKDAVAKLPADEREACQKLWADVAELLKNASEAK